MKPACWCWAAANVVARQPSWELSPVSLLYPITAVSALAAFHQPVLVHWPVDGSYHRCRAPAPAVAQAWKSGSATAFPSPVIYPAISAVSSAPSSQQASRSCLPGGPVTVTGGRTLRHCRPVAIDSTARTAPPVSEPPCTYRPNGRRRVASRHG